MRSSLLARLERSSCLPLIALIGAMWPVWQWVATRAASDTGDAWSLLSLATAAALIWRGHVRRVAGAAPEARPAWSLAAALMLLYAAAYPFAPPLVRAMIAMSALASACSTLWFRSRMQLWLWGLLLLSLPLIPSLNFYAGYPLRAVVGDLTCLLLQMDGFAAVRDGATLLWNERQIAIDAPCSGIKMLWTGAYLCCALAGLQRFNARGTLLLGALTLIIVILANVLRASALFFVEGGILPQAAPAHELIGVVAFTMAALAVAAVAAKLRRIAHAC